MFNLLNSMFSPSMFTCYAIYFDNTWYGAHFRLVLFIRNAVHCGLFIGILIFTFTSMVLFVSMVSIKLSWIDAKWLNTITDEKIFIFCFLSLERIKWFQLTANTLHISSILSLLFLMIFYLKVTNHWVLIYLKYPTSYKIFLLYISM